MPTNPDYIHVRHLVLSGKINTIDALFAAIPVNKLARDLRIEIDELSKIILSIGHITIEQIEQLAEITGIPLPMVRKMVFFKADQLFAHPIGNDAIKN